MFEYLCLLGSYQEETVSSSALLIAQQDDWWWQCCSLNSLHNATQAHKKCTYILNHGQTGEIVLKYLGDISWEAWSFLARLDPQLSGVCQAELDQLCKCLWTACNAPHLKKHSQCTPPRACLSSASELQQMCTLDTVHYALHKWDWSSFILALNFSVINIGKNMWFFWDKLRVFLGWV